MAFKGIYRDWVIPQRLMRTVPTPDDFENPAGRARNCPLSHRRVQQPNSPINTFVDPGHRQLRATLLAIV
jgi:hypothetical protein